MTMNTNETDSVNGGFVLHTRGEVASCYNTAYHLSCLGLSDCVC